MATISDAVVVVGAYSSLLVALHDAQQNPTPDAQEALQVAAA